MPLEASNEGRGGWKIKYQTYTFNLSFKKKRIKYIGGDLSWKGGDTLPRNSLNLPRTYEKLCFKGQKYGFSGYIHTES